MDWSPRCTRRGHLSLRSSDDFAEQGLVVPQSTATVPGGMFRKDAARRRHFRPCSQPANDLPAGSLHGRCPKLLFQDLLPSSSWSCEGESHCRDSDSPRVAPKEGKNSGKEA